MKTFIEHINLSFEDLRKKTNKIITQAALKNFKTIQRNRGM